MQHEGIRRRGGRAPSRIFRRVIVGREGDRRIMYRVYSKRWCAITSFGGDNLEIQEAALRLMGRFIAK